MQTGDQKSLFACIQISFRLNLCSAPIVCHAQKFGLYKANRMYTDE